MVETSPQWIRYRDYNNEDFWEQRRGDTRGLRGSTKELLATEACLYTVSLHHEHIKKGTNVNKLPNK